MIRTVFGITLAALALGAALLPAQPQAQELDARFVRMDVPKQVAADQVFAVKITFKNTGTEVWREARGVQPPALKPSGPEQKPLWGTDTIILAQGATVNPGQEYTYATNLRAPPEPGRYVFQWRPATGAGPFGEATAKLEITVTKGTGPKELPLAAARPDKGGKRPLTFDDFEYLGSFKLPERVGKGGGGFSESGIALRKLSGTARRLFVNYTHPEGSLFEVDVPVPVAFEGGNANPLPTAKVHKEWGGLASKDKKYAANGGLVWDDDKRLMYWTFYHGYWTGGDLPVLHATKLADDGTVTPVGSWTVPRQKWHWGGVTRLPKSFASKYTVGHTLALGFGGYYSIVAPCSRGPALSVLADPDPANGAVGHVATLLGHPEGTAAPRPGDFFNANCGFWAEQPRNRTAGIWSFTDHCKTGVMIDLPDRQGFIAFAKLGTGRLGYDYGHITCAGESQCWYFYDVRQLGETVQRERKVGTVLPYAIQPDPGRGGAAHGACFDEAERTLYVLRGAAYELGREKHPLVHVYKVKK